MWQCHCCHQQLSAEVQKKNRLCPTCNSDLHCCKNCTHYDESQSTQCKEPESPWVRDRASQNTCPYFEFVNHKYAPQKQVTNHERAAEAEKAKEAFKALFRDL